MEVGGETSQVAIAETDDGAFSLEVDGVRRRLRVAVDGDRSFVHGPLGSAELTEIRYSGQGALVLRGLKAVY